MARCAAYYPARGRAPISPPRVSPARPSGSLCGAPPIAASLLPASVLEARVTAIARTRRPARGAQRPAYLAGGGRGSPAGDGTVASKSRARRRKRCARARGGEKRGAARGSRQRAPPRAPRGGRRGGWVPPRRKGGSAGRFLAPPQRRPLLASPYWFLRYDCLRSIAARSSADGALDPPPFGGDEPRRRAGSSCVEMCMSWPRGERARARCSAMHKGVHK